MNLDLRFAALGDLLLRWRGLWHPRPFVGDPPWLEEHPALVERLLALDDEGVEALERRPGECWPELAAELAELSALPALPSIPSEAPLPEGVKARKWSQVQSFAGMALPELRHGIVDWCSGKGHLGRALSELSGLPWSGVERDARLCPEGGQNLDVLQSEPIIGRSTVVALHACGLLTDRALELATGGVIAAPCCFHAYRTEYAPRSPGATDLVLDRDDLRLAAAEEVVAGARLQRLRREEMAWRLGLDLLRREASGIDRYTPLRPVPTAWINAGFEEFVRRVSREYGVAVPARWDPAAVEAEGWRRARRARALGIPRGIFRRGLEVWIELDRARWMHARGRRVRVGTFCAYGMTPRNIALIVDPT